MAASPIGDLADFLKAFPQYTERDYMYKLSVAKIMFLTNDSTHIKYLEGEDKRLWENYHKQFNSDEKGLQGKSIIDIIPEE